MKVVTSKLLTWYAHEHRDLPWRRTLNPYEIWVSEMILQQTRVEQGLPYYHRFLDKFPQITDLAAAHETEVLKVWQGLGYYARARNMHQTAKEIVAKHQGVFPNSYESLLQLKGVGPYTAAAIASFAFKIPVPAIDGNVKRVVSRLFNISKNVDSLSFYKEAHAFLTDLIPENSADLFNQAMIELGAMLCTPKQAQCNLCPLREHCLAHSLGITEQLPLKKSKVKVRFRSLVFVQITFKNQVLIQKRGSEGIWGGLYEFPNFDVNEIPTEEFPQRECPWVFLKDANMKFHFLQKHKHKLSHQNQEAFLYALELDRLLHPSELEGDWIPKEELKSFPLHKLMLKFVTN